MAAKQKRSKKRSAASSRRPPKPHVFFIERNLGKYKVARALRAAGERVEIHDDYLSPDAPDEEWIRLVGRRGWIAITKDKNIRYRQWEREAIVRYKARIFVIRAKNVTADAIGVVLIKARNRIKRYADGHAPPFVAAIYRDGGVKTYPLGLGERESGSVRSLR